MVLEYLPALVAARIRTLKLIDERCDQAQRIDELYVSCCSPPSPDVLVNKGLEL